MPLRTIALAVLVSWVFALSLAADWETFHGPNRDNKSPETGLAETWPEEGPPLVRTVTGAGMGFATVTVRDGAFFTAGIHDNVTYVMAYTREGELKWKTPNGESWNPTRGWSARYRGSRATPTLGEDLVFHMTEMGRLAAFDIETGVEAWATDLTERFGATRPNWSYSESVLVDGERLLCYPGGSRGYMVALDKRTGETVWANTDANDGAGYASISIREWGGVRHAIAFTAGHVLGVDADNGKLLWKFPWRNRRSINVAIPIFHEGRVFASCGYGQGSVMLELDKDGEEWAAREVWRSQAPDNHHGHLQLVDGFIYGAGDQQRGWSCLDFETGEVMYRDPLSGKGSILHADGRFYVLDERGEMMVVPVSSEEWAPTSAFRVPRGGEGLFWAHPVISDGLLYIRHADAVHIYDARER